MEWRLILWPKLISCYGSHVVQCVIHVAANHLSCHTCILTGHYIWTLIRYSTVTTAETFEMSDNIMMAWWQAFVPIGWCTEMFQIICVQLSGPRKPVSQQNAIVSGSSGSCRKHLGQFVCFMSASFMHLKHQKTIYFICIGCRWICCDALYECLMNVIAYDYRTCRGVVLKKEVGGGTKWGDARRVLDYMKCQ